MRMILLQCWYNQDGGDFGATLVSESEGYSDSDLEWQMVDYVESQFPNAKYIYHYDDNNLPACDIVIDGKINNRVLYERE